MANHLFHEILLTCEHAGNSIPARYGTFFDGADDILNSHRGWDPGAEVLAYYLSHSLGIPLISYPYSRLLIEPNRSEHHPKLFSEYTKSLPADAKQDLLNHYYRPHRSKVSNEIYRIISQNKRVLHIGVHTFTPELDGNQRNFDMGLLYDPSRKMERVFSQSWKKRLQTQFSIRMNQPYKGKADGLITTLRKLFSEQAYLGIELEVNQALYFEGSQRWDEVCKGISNSLTENLYFVS
jgi:predicted N-formylglutamate amidohydrolase